MTAGLTAEQPAPTRQPEPGVAKLTGAELYRRGAGTLLASWEQYARGVSGATVQRLAGVAAAVFPNEPERAVYNNALLERDLGAAERAVAVSAMEAAYEAAGVARFAAWVHESDAAMRSALERRGYTVDEVTRAMGMTLDDIRLPQPALELGSADWSEHLRLAGMPRGFLGCRRGLPRSRPDPRVRPRAERESTDADRGRVTVRRTRRRDERARRGSVAVGVTLPAVAALTGNPTTTQEIIDVHRRAAHS